jgi:prophage antirepressor-like protein
MQHTSFLTSQGVYRLLYTSKKEVAKKFRKWAGNILDDIIFNESTELKRQIEINEKKLLEKEQLLIEHKEQTVLEKEQLLEVMVQQICLFFIRPLFQIILVQQLKKQLWINT